MAKLSDLSKNSGNPQYYSLEFVRLVSSHRDRIKKLSSTKKVAIDQTKAFFYYGDFYGYLMNIGIDPCYHWLFLHFNNLSSSCDFDENLTEIIIPDQGELNKLLTAQKFTKEGLM